MMFEWQKFLILLRYLLRHRLCKYVLIVRVTHCILVFLQVGVVELLFDFILLLVALHVLLIGQLGGVKSTLLLNGSSNGLSLVKLIKNFIV